MSVKLLLTGMWFRGLAKSSSACVRRIIKPVKILKKIVHCVPDIKLTPSTLRFSGEPLVHKSFSIGKLESLSVLNHPFAASVGK